MDMMNHRMESLAAAAALQNSEAAAAYYGYGDRVEGSAMESASSINSSSEEFGLLSSVPGSPLPADRLARKQRNFPRRGGFCHSALLKSAVMACMSEGPETHNRNGTITASPDGASSAGDLSVSDLLHGGGGTASSTSSSPRKRMRRTDHAVLTGGGPAGAGGTTADDAVIARATDLLQQLCVKSLDHSEHALGNSRHLVRGLSSSRHSRAAADADFDRKAPVRRVSRRTSYTSQISTGTDYDDLEDDEFH